MVCSRGLLYTRAFTRTTQHFAYSAEPIRLNIWLWDYIFFGFGEGLSLVLFICFPTKRLGNRPPVSSARDSSITHPTKRGEEQEPIPVLDVAVQLEFLLLLEKRA